MKRRGLLAVLLTAVMTLLCGCGGMSAEDAQSYAKSILDASYKGEFDAYIEWTKSTKEEAQELYENNSEVSLQEAGYSQLGLSEELQEDYRQLYLDICKQANYEVGEAKEKGNDAYAIEVTVKPFIGFDGLQEETDVAAMAKEEDIDLNDQEAINEMVFRKRYEIMAERAASPVYGDPVTVTLNVKKDSDGVYYIDPADLKTLDEALFPPNS